MAKRDLLYYIIHKPYGVLSQFSEESGNPGLGSLYQLPKDIYPVGRLDRPTTGLLLFTNDGFLAKQLTHPSSKVSKTYHVHLDKKVTKSHLTQLVEGVNLDDGMTHADKAYYEGDMEDKSRIVIELHSGKNRVIRRMMEALGYKVLRLDRTIFAGLTKKNLPRGKCRHLTEAEVGLLHRISGLR